MAKTPQIIDQWGDPVSTALLKEEIAAPTLGSVRSVWTETVIAGLDPLGMSEILVQAARGFPDRFFALAEEMEERDLHYRSVLGTRKLAITGVPPIVAPASKDTQDQKIADAVRELIAEPAFPDDYVSDLADGLGKGYSVVETIWDRSEHEWRPKAYKRRDQRHFVIDQVDGTTLRLKHPDAPTTGIDLPAFKFSIHRPKLKSGLPIRNGLARLAAWAFLFKSYTLKDWMAFLEVYGMPLRVGKFGRGASHEDRRILLQAVRDISTDAAAIIPKEMEIEFIEVQGGSGNGLFGSKAEYLDKQVSKGVLGQTMSTDDGSSLSQAKIHENVRHDIARADARQIAVTMNRDLIRPFVDLNFGPQQRYPTVIIPVTENEDIKTLAEAVERLVDRGLEVSMAEIRSRLGFDEPEPGAKIMRPSAAFKADSPSGPPAGTAQARQQSACPHCGGFHAVASDQRDEVDQLIDDALADWESDLDPLLKPLRALFERAKSYEQLLAGLDDLAAKLDAGPLADRLAKLQMKARGLGDIGGGA
jgi:phage gp29-like protein